jgi:hypothetical protein
MEAQMKTVTTKSPAPRTHEQTAATPPATELAAALRDVAFVLQMTRRVKSAILADQPEPKSAARRTEGKPEHLVGV